MSAPRSTNRTFRPARRVELLMSCGAAAVALVAGAGQASAQAFQADHMVVAGSVTRNSGPATDTITVDSPTAIVNWDPFPDEGTGVIDFLPAGHIATFQNGANTTDFMILNRILPRDPTRAVAFNGTVISQLQTAAGPVRGGTVAFYSPGGIIIGRSAVFDIGNLLLTTIDPIADGNGGFFHFNTFDLRGPVDPNSFVRIEAGAEITATAANSWVAVASPRVEQFGAVRVNGSVAYIAAEALTLTINNGLFDILVETGSSSADHTLVHTGSTGGPASTGADDPHNIYMVAVPKNTAVTALLSGSAGFDAAVSAGVENGEIILSAGRNILGGAFIERPDSPASFNILSGTYTSDVRGSASVDFTAGSPGGDLDFSGDLTLLAGGTAHLLAQDSTVAVGGDVTLRADVRGGPGATIDATGGEALITATGNAAIRIGGNAVLSANGTGGVDGQTGTVGHGTGGTVRVDAEGGTIVIAGDLRGDALGSGGFGETDVTHGGDGTGGSITLAASNGGSVSVGGETRLAAHGSASGGTGTDTTGATGTGGTVSATASTGGSIAATGPVSLAANGHGGLVAAASGTGGTGRGGTVSVAADGGTIGFAGGSEIAATGRGGDGPDGGRGEGGTATVEATGASVTLAGTSLVTASGTGGDAASPGGGRGGDGIGGTLALVAHSGAEASTIEADELTLFAQGTGGAGGDGAAGMAGGRGGDGTGGTLLLLAEAVNGNLALGTVYGQAAGLGGDGGAGGSGADGGRGGDGTGGTAEAGTVGGPINGTVAGSATFAALELDAVGDGGAGGTGAAPGAGGDAAGGHAALTSEGAPVTVTGAASLSASGFADAGGTGTGGTLDIGARRADDATPGLLRVGTLSGSAGGFGDDSAANRPGSWTLFAIGSAVEAADISLDAGANGAAAAAAPSAVTLDDGTVTVTGRAELQSGGDLTVDATGSGRLQGGEIVLAAPFGGIAIDHAGRDPAAATIAGSALLANSLGDFTQGPGARIAVTGTIDAVAGGDVTLTDASAGQRLAVEAGGTIRVDALATAPDIAFRSSGIAISADGRLGSDETESVLLEVAAAHGADGEGVSGNAAVIGGTAEGDGYTLDAAEAGRIRTRALAIVAPLSSNDAARTADVIVRNVTFSGADGLESVSITTPGRILVEGKLEFAAAGDGDSLTLEAADRLQVVTPSGSVAVLDADGNPDGTLIVRAGDIWVTDAALAGQLAADPNFAGRDAALLANPGAVEPAGYIQAGRAELYPGKTLFVQNSGTADVFAGITVGTGGLLIRPAGAEPAAVTAFGRGRNADGSFTTGEAFFGAVEFGGPESAGFTEESEFNRCRIVTGQCPEEPPPPEEPDPVPPLDLSQGTLLGPVSPARPAGIAVPEIVDTGAFLSQPLIDEPVASGGDGGLWAGGDEENEEEDEEEDEE